MKPFAPKEAFLKAAAESLGDMLDRLDGLADFDCSKAPKGKVCVFSVDMNQGFAKEGNLYSPRVEDMIEDTALFLESCCKAGIPVVFFSDRHTKASPELESYPEHCIGEEESAIVERLSPMAPAPRFKNSTNAFFANTEDILKRGFTTYVITGCCTDICIYQFAVSLKAYCNEKNIPAQVVVPMRYVDTYDSQWHNADLANVVFLDSLAANGVLVCDGLLLPGQAE